jgi:hypothetical protein
MAIDPNHQRKGIGGCLVKAVENFGISIGCLRMEVTTGDRREHDAHRFYSALDTIPIAVVSSNHSPAPNRTVETPPPTFAPHRDRSAEDRFVAG